MALETPQGRADHMARSIEVFGRILSLDEMLGEIRAVDVSRRPRRRCGVARRADRRRVGRREARARGVSDLQTLVAEPWADWGLIDCGGGQKLERYGPYQGRPARAAGDVGAGAQPTGIPTRPSFPGRTRRAEGAGCSIGRCRGSGSCRAARYDSMRR